ncbi:MAG: hypothetical protein VKO39_06075 [Cyanobacteriota bacterium]|nr:hypothetical protein [Cyanobacteriota bacterium]
MTVLEAVMASLVLMLGTSTSAWMWNHGLRTSLELAQREERLQRLDALLLASEGMARRLATQLQPASDCDVAIAQLLPQLRALPAARSARLTQPSSPAGTVHLRWEADGLRRERLFSASALRLCVESQHAA